jgi:hypothetical protein
MSKTGYYENPCSVTGTSKQTGSKELSKDICKDRIIGTLEVGNMEDLIPMKC